MKNGRALEFASEEMKRRDKDFIGLGAVTQYGEALVWKSYEMRRDKDDTLAALTQNGGSLKQASEYMQRNKEVVLTAVTQTGFVAVHDASSGEMQRDHRGMLAVARHIFLLEIFADDILEEDRRFVVAALVDI